MTAPARRAVLILAAGLALLAAALGGLYVMGGPGGARLAEVAGPQIGGPFALTDQDGRRVSEQSWPGRHLLLFFGFTHCPDVCPLALGEVSVALDALGPAAAKLQPLFVTVDPERDTPAALKDYVSAFDDRIVGLTGTAEEIAAAARAYRVYYKKAPVQGALGYTMDHSAFVYLVSPQGKLEAFFTHETKGAAMAEKIKGFLAKG
ncbi:MAG: SCO family protein [Alphaproteobacteria bacterium]|nr:SCO family protein [Alphaproteobacteria bacterium]